MSFLLVVGQKSSAGAKKLIANSFLPTNKTLNLFLSFHFVPLCELKASSDKKTVIVEF